VIHILIETTVTLYLNFDGYELNSAGNLKITLEPFQFQTARNNTPFILPSSTTDFQYATLEVGTNFSGPEFGLFVER
jgi:hypothetical protein